MSTKNDMPDNNDETKKHPEWKQAVEDFIKEFKIDDIVPLDWLQKAFGMNFSKSMKYNEFKSKSLAFMASFQKFEEELLIEHHIHLKNIRGVGYRVVPPGEQADIAYDGTMKDIKKSIRKANTRIVNVDREKLTAEEKQNHTDKIAKIVKLKSLFKQRNLIKFFKPEEPKQITDETQ